jgi:hypothetical protein
LHIRLRILDVPDLSNPDAEAPAVINFRALHRIAQIIQDISSQTAWLQVYRINPIHAPQQNAPAFGIITLAPTRPIISITRKFVDDIYIQVTTGLNHSVFVSLCPIF